MTSSQPKGRRSPQSGDLVRAAVDSRDGETVEGVLHIRHVPSLDYVEITVAADGRSCPVVPESVEVIQPGRAAAKDLEAGDPLPEAPGSRVIASLDEVARAGLLPETRVREGGSWDDLFDELARRAQALLDAGWRLVSTDRDVSREYGDSVFWDLEREGQTVELEYYEHGQLVAYPVSDSDDGNDDGEPTPAYFAIPDSTVDNSRAAFADQGWL